MPKPTTQNTLFYGDNLPILREHIPNEGVDLIYLDPTFKHAVRGNWGSWAPIRHYEPAGSNL